MGEEALKGSEGKRPGVSIRVALHLVQEHVFLHGLLEVAGHVSLAPQPQHCHQHVHLQDRQPCHHMCLHARQEAQQKPS